MELELGHITSGMLRVNTIEAARVESTIPSAYRLAKHKSGELVLQGCYTWQKGFAESGYEWRDIPTFELP